MQTVSFEPTQADLIAAGRAHFWVSLRSWRTLRTYLLGAATFAVVASLFAWGEDAIGLGIAAVGGALFWTLILTFILLVNYIFLPARSRRTFIQ